MVLRTFESAELKNICLDVVVGPNYVHMEKLEAAAAFRGETCIHTQLPDLSELIANVDLAIGAGGATTWERCCLGLPSIVVSIAENQRLACEALEADNIIRYGGQVADVTQETFSEQIFGLIVKPKRLVELSENGMKLVDGNGIERVTEALKLSVAS